MGLLIALAPLQIAASVDYLFGALIRHTICTFELFAEAGLGRRESKLVSTTDAGLADATTPYSALDLVGL